MPNFFFKIDQNLLPIFVDQIRHISESLKEELAIEIQFSDNDQELSSSWENSLIENLQVDCHNLLLLLENKSFGQKSIYLDIELSECVLRACSAIRHKLRSTFLAEISDADIELCELNLTQLPSKTRKPYACYVFLAYLQESIIQSMQLS